MHRKSMTLVSYFAFTYRYRKFLLLRCIILMPQRCLDMLVIKQGIEHILLASFRPDIASSKLASFSYAIALLSSRYRKKFVLAYCTRCELQSAHMMKSSHVMSYERDTRLSVRSGDRSTHKAGSGSDRCVMISSHCDYHQTF